MGSLQAELQRAGFIADPARLAIAEAYLTSEDVYSLDDLVGIEKLWAPPLDFPPEDFTFLESLVKRLNRRRETGQGFISANQPSLCLANQQAKSCCCGKEHPITLQSQIVMPDPADVLYKMAASLFSMPGKDVLFELADGEEKAHKLILMAGSEVFQRMLQCGMSEASTHRIALPDVDRVTMKVFLRLLYTGHADPEDWKPSFLLVSKETDSGATVPLPIILNVAILVKKYMVKFLVYLTTQTLILRLNFTLEKLGAIDLWDKTMAGIIKNGIGPALSAGLNAAKGNYKLRAKFHARELSPEVQYELSAFWGSPASQSKRARFA